MSKPLNFAMLMVLAATASCSDDDCPASLDDVCANQECPDTPRVAIDEPESYPHVLRDGEKVVVGNDEGHGGWEFHFTENTLVGYRSYTDILPREDECSSVTEVGTLHTEFRELGSGGCDTESCGATCTFNGEYEGDFTPCPTDLFESP